MHFVVYVRGAEPDARAVLRAPSDLVAKDDGDPAITAQTLVSIREDGPFEPLIEAIRRNGALRDALGTQIQIPSLRHYRRLRIILTVIVLLPIAVLLELDRELAFGGKASTSRVLVDLILVGWLGFELSRATPRRPRIAATCLGALALRWALVITKSCGAHVHPLVWCSAVFAALGAVAWLFRVPTPDRIVLELLGKLGITRAELNRASEPVRPPPALIAAAIAAAAGLPALLHLVRAMGAGFMVQSLVFVGFAAAAPLAARRLGEPGATPPRAFPPGRLGEPPRAFAPGRIMLAVATGLALTAAAITMGRLFFDAGAEVARCVNRLDSEARLARAAETQELARAIERVRGSAPLVFLTAAVFPFAEERIYRGLLQDTLVRRYGTTYGIFATALAFGVAHLGVYEVALYQTVLLGLGFGLAYAEGGILAAFFVHAVWNLLQVA